MSSTPDGPKHPPITSDQYIVDISSTRPPINVKSGMSCSSQPPQSPEFVNELISREGFKSLPQSPPDVAFGQKWDLQCYHSKNHNQMQLKLTKLSSRIPPHLIELILPQHPEPGTTAPPLLCSVRLSKNTTSASKGTPFNVAIVECTVQLRRYKGSAYALHIPKRICKKLCSAGAVVKEGLESELQKPWQQAKHQPSSFSADLQWLGTW